MVFRISGQKMPNNLVLGPMYRITDLAFRLLCREQGAGLCFSEMVNSEALIRNNAAARRLTQSCPEDRPLSLQLFGARPESMKKAASLVLESRQFDFLDLNLGCPSDNVLNQGAGSALLKRPSRVSEIISSWVDLGAVATAKIRISPNVLQSIKLAKQVEKAGAACIAVHARPVKQKNRGFVDFVALKRIKKSIGIPVIGNGGIDSMESFERTLSKTGCDAAMVGQAAIGNPGIFAKILGKKPVSREQAFFQYLELCKKHEINYFGRVKQQAVSFFSQHKCLVPRLEKAKTLEELAAIAKGFGKNY